MSALLAWKIRKKKEHGLSEEEKKSKAAGMNQFKLPKKKEITRIIKEEVVIPFIDMLPDKTDKEKSYEVKELALLNLQSEGMFESFHDVKYKHFLKKTIHEISHSHELVLEDFATFHKNYLQTGLIHKLPENWSVPKGNHLMGFVPKELLCAVMHYLCRDKDNNIRKIEKNGHDICETTPGSGWYRMLNDKKDNASIELMVDPLLTQLLPGFKNIFLKSNGIESTDKECNKWHLAFGVVGTRFATVQMPHCDFAKKDQANSWILHFPVQSEGTLHSVFDQDNNLHRYVYCPFGTFLALRGDVWHSGFFGNKGNCRFHLIMRKGKFPKVERLHVPDEQTEKLLASRKEKVHADFF